MGDEVGVAVGAGVEVVVGVGLGVGHEKYDGCQLSENQDTATVASDCSTTDACENDPGTSTQPENKKENTTTETTKNRHINKRNFPTDK